MSRGEYTKSEGVYDNHRNYTFGLSHVKNRGES